METGDDELGELYDLTRQLRGQLLRHANLGAWAAPGGATARALAAPTDEAAASELAGASEDAVPVAALEDGSAAAAAVPRGPQPPSAGAPAAGAPASLPRRPAVASEALPAAEPAVPASSAFARPAAAPPAAFTLTSPSPPPAERPAATPAAPAAELFAPAPAAPLVRRTLPQIRAELGDCTRCKLHSTRRSIVFGVGAADTPLMFVGEAPGEQEDRRGEPFVGPAGELLDKMIEAMGWTRSAVYIANTTKCRPPGNRNPQPDELSQCMPFLHAQIASIAPRIIVALGRPASNQLLEVDAPISSLRGRFHDYPKLGQNSLKIMPTFHPAYLLRDPDKKRLAWADLKLVMAELTRLGIAPPARPAP